MKAIVISEYGAPEQLKIEERQTPNPESGQVLIKVKAFGINRAETYMRQGAWGEVAEITGIECVGTVELDTTGRLVAGTKVVAIMGGMGRTINGSYAEYTCLPASNVVAINADIPWDILAAIPESYATAWACLHDNMKLKPGDSVLVRGGTSALGQAAINIAANTKEVSVIASTRSRDCVEMLKGIGATSVLFETDDMSSDLRTLFPRGVDSVLDIIGNSTLLDSLKMVKPGGYVCNAGFLGGGDPLSFNPLSDLPCSVNLNFFASFMFGTDGFPLSNIPVGEIVDKVVSGAYVAAPKKVFEFEQIVDAHRLMESNTTKGKIVIKL